MKIPNFFHPLENGDERIQNEISTLAAKLYPLIILLTIIVCCYKLVFLKLEYTQCISEYVAIIFSLGYYIVRVKQAGLTITYGKDEYLRGIQNKYLCHSFYIAFFAIIWGEFIIFFFIDTQMKMHSLLYILIWIIPATIFTYKILMKGLMLLGTKKTAKTVTKKFKRNTIIGSLFYGIMMNWKWLIVDNSFQPIGIIHVLISSLLWGIPFYWIMKTMFQISEKQANKTLDEE